MFCNLETRFLVRDHGIGGGAGQQSVSVSFLKRCLPLLNEKLLLSILLVSSYAKLLSYFAYLSPKMHLFFILQISPHPYVLTSLHTCVFWQAMTQFDP